MKISEIIVEKVLPFKGNRKRKVANPTDRLNQLIQYRAQNRSFKYTLKTFSNMLELGDITPANFAKEFKKSWAKQPYQVKPEALKKLQEILKTAKDTEVPELRKQLQSVMRLSNITAKDKNFMSAVRKNLDTLDALPEPEESDEEYWGVPEYTVLGDPGNTKFPTRREAEIHFKKLKLQGLAQIKVFQTGGKPDDETNREREERFPVEPSEPEHIVVLVDDDGDEYGISTHTDKKEAIQRAREESLKRPGRPKIKVVSVGE